tara:strand:+ start:25041 stop:25400 length:360 start_codon:yes stop_codon:yes gene_type:complete
MAVRLGSEAEVEVAILVGDDEVTAVFPPHGDSELNEAIKKLATTRQSSSRGVVKDNSFEARTRFFNTQCRRVLNVEGPDGLPLTADTPEWRKLIPANWKVSFSLFFEEKMTLSSDDVGN